MIRSFRIYFYLTIIVGFLLIPTVSTTRELLSLKDYLKKALAQYPKMTRESFSLSEEQAKSLKALAASAQDKGFTFYYGRILDGSMERACTVVAQAGKEGPLSIGVCFSPKGLVESVDFLVFSEDRGQGVLKDVFLSQFNGKNAGSSFVVGNDIDAVAGATKTSWAVAEAIRKASFAFRVFVKEK
jgi:Na+-translocating ferredoxin:NAD+ oxidoreductase RnfG subunit